MLEKGIWKARVASVVVHVLYMPSAFFFFANNKATVIRYCTLFF